MSTLDIRVVPILSDNYVFLLRDTASGEVAVVDPGEAEPVEAALAAAGWRLGHILATHHHGDHIAGIAPLKARTGVPVVGPAADAGRIPGLDRGVREGDVVQIGATRIDVIETPGHTVGHVAFHAPTAAALFCGDTLFSLGCGRMSEGTPAQFWSSLAKLRALPDATRVHCGHEYTQSNARFALSVLPDDPDLKRRAEEVARLRAAGQPTVPSVLGEEKRANPFLRCDDPAIATAVGLPGGDPTAVFAALRKRKDAF